MTEETVVKAKDTEINKVYKTQKGVFVLIFKKDENAVKARTAKGVPIEIHNDYELFGPCEEHVEFNQLEHKRKTTKSNKTSKPKDNTEINKKYEDVSAIIKEKYSYKERKGYISFSKNNIKLRLVKETNRVVIWSPKTELPGCKISRQGKYGFVYDVADNENLAFLKG